MGSFEKLFENPDTIKDWVVQFGFWAPVIVILLQVIQSSISIIPSQVTTIIAGFLFGPVLGLMYSLIGATIGSSAVFLGSRKYGKKLVSKVFSKKEVVHFHKLFKQKGSTVLLFGRLAPLFPNDLVSISAGLLPISFRQFTIYSTLGFIFQMVLLTFFGARLSTGNVDGSLMIISVIVGVLVFIVLFKKQIKRIVIKDIHLLEAKEKAVEKKIEKEFAKI